jgi:hypothetical protein
MRMNRRQFVAALSMLATNLAEAQPDRPANRNIKWALSEALWRYYPPAPFTDMLAVMRETGFIGLRLASFPRILSAYQITPAQILREVSKRDLHVVTISWNGALHDSSQRQIVLDSARSAMCFSPTSAPITSWSFRRAATCLERNRLPHFASCASVAIR